MSCIKTHLSRFAPDYSNNSFSHGSFSSRTASAATLTKFGPRIHFQMTFWRPQIIEHKVKAPMTISNESNDQDGQRMSKRLKKNPEEVQTLLKLNMCSKRGDLHGALHIFDRVKREGVLQLKQYHYNVLLYICSGAASGILSKGKCGKDEKGSGIGIPHIGKLVQREDQKLEMVTEMQVERSSDPAYSASRSLTGSTPGQDNFSSQEIELAARRGLEIYEEMLAADVPLSEATFTSIARLACAKGDGDLAFEMVKRMTAANITPKLRSYVPAVKSYCENNEVQKAFEVDKHMLAAGVLPDENLLDALLKASVEAGLEDKVYSLLQRLRTAARELSPATVDNIESWFNSSASISAGTANCPCLLSKEELKLATEARGGGWHGQGWLGKGPWRVQRTTMNKLGVCMFCGEQLCTIDIDPQETESFAKSIADLACQRGHQSNNFKAFQKWVDEHGPFDAVVDGANIGLYNSLFSRVFNFDQLDAVVKEVRTRSLTNKPPLVILHCRRTTDETALSGNVQAVFKMWTEENALFTTPHGFNDDWYWLYAAVKCKCLLVTNDEMRDHLFELLGKEFFPKWKERHQVRFTFISNALELHMPLPYSIVIQESQNGSWHIPQLGGDEITTTREWLCVTRPDPAIVLQ